MYQNPAKAMALELADASPLVWGGSILAARASRRIGPEALRAPRGRVVLWANTGAVARYYPPSRPRDSFADPFRGRRDGASARGLVMIDDGRDDEQAAEEQQSSWRWRAPKRSWSPI